MSDVNLFVFIGGIGVKKEPICTALPALLVALGLILFLFACSENEKIAGPENRKPNTPQALAPTDNSIDQITDLELTWQCADLEGDSLKYDVCFGTQADPPLAASGLTEAEYNPGLLEYNTSYRWRVAVTDEHGASTLGQIWRFETVSTSGLYLVGSCDLNQEPFFETAFHVSGGLAYLEYLLDWDSELMIIDIADAEHPAIASRFRTAGHINEIAADGETVFLAESGGIEIMDVSSPSLPRRAGYYQSLGRVVSIATWGDYAYVSGWPGIFTLDISNPANPVVVDSVEGIGGVEVSGNYAFIGYGCAFEVSCIDSYVILPDHTLQLINSINTENTMTDFTIAFQNLFILTNQGDIIAWNLGMPSDPKYAYRFSPPEFERHQAIFAIGDILYASCHTLDGQVLQMYNVRDVQNPFLIASYATPSPIVSIRVANNYVYLLDREPSLKIFAYLP